MANSKEIRMLTMLARSPGWSGGLGEEMRAKVAKKLEEGLDEAKSPRDIASITKAAVSLERADIDLARLLMDAQAADRDTSDDGQAKVLLDDLESIRRQNAGEGWVDAD